MSLTYVVAYARFSSDNQREESIDAQLRAIRQYCQQHDYILLDTYVDEARSATTDDRPAFQQMIKDSASGDWSAVIVHKLDRFSRNRYDSAIYKKQLKDNGVHVESVLERLDDSPESVILESLLEGMSEYYSKNLAREVLKGKHETALQCKHNGGQPPYGLMVNKDGTYAINEYEAEAVRMMFDLTLSGHSQSAIRNILSHAGYKTRSGKPFCGSTINNMLHNEKYNGTFVYNRVKPQPKGGKRTNESRPDDEIMRIPNGIPAIIDAQTWNDVQEVLERRSDQASKRSEGGIEVYLLQGLIKCGNCGSAMVGCRRKDGRNKKLRISYECNGRKRKHTDCQMRNINRDYIEDIVIDYIEQCILSDDAMAKVKKMLLDEIDAQQKATGSLDSLQKELARVEAGLNKLIDAIIAGIDALSLKDKIDALEAKKALLNSQISTVKARQATFGQIDIDSLDCYLARYRNIRSHPRRHQKEIIHKFVKEVLVYDNDTDGDKIVLTLKVPASSITLQPSKSGDTVNGVLSPYSISEIQRASSIISRLSFYSTSSVYGQPISNKHCYIIDMAHCLSLTESI